MSTFDSTLNAGASYIVKDLYQSYVKPDASSKQLMRASRWATIGLCVAGVGLASIVPNINAIWQLVTMGLGAGLFVPLFLRWYWPRFNGWGFATGTGAGIVGALIFNAAMALPLYQSFPAVIGCAFAGSVVGTYLTAPVSEQVLIDFWVRINPWGLWGRIGQLALKRGTISKEKRLERTIENLNDWVALCFAIPFQLCLLLGGMSFIFHDWKKFAFFAIGGVFSSIGLYFFWYRNLKSDAECKKEDAMYAAKKSDPDGGAEDDDEAAAEASS